jgi:hypothetical protein
VLGRVPSEGYSTSRMAQLPLVFVVLGATASMFGCSSSAAPPVVAPKDGATSDLAADGTARDVADDAHAADAGDGPPRGDGPNKGDKAGDVAPAPDGPTGDASETRDGGSSTLFAPVQAIFDASCISCHDAKLVPNPIPDLPPPYPALPLTRGASYAALVGRPAVETCAGTLVTPGDVGKSYLFTIVSQDNPCTGRRMPRGGGSIRPPAPLPDTEIAAIRAWITGGAPR